MSVVAINLHVHVVPPITTCKQPYVSLRGYEEVPGPPPPEERQPHLPTLLPANPSNNGCRLYDPLSELGPLSHHR